MKEIEVGGEVLEFPDSMSDDEILKVLRRHYPSTQDDTELTRLQNRTPTLGSPQVRQRAEHTEIRKRIAGLEKQKEQLKRNTSLPRVEKAKQIRTVQAAIDALQDQLPDDTFSTLGGIGGAIGGAAIGSALSPIGTAGGSIAGGFIGTLGGALIDAQRQELEGEDLSAFLLTKGVETIVFDTAGNLIFWGGGKALGKIARDTAPGRWLVHKLGGKIRQAHEVAPGDRVFADTTDAELQQSAAAAADRLARVRIGDRPAAPTAGQMGEETGYFERQVRAKNPRYFERTQHAQESAVQGDVRDTAEQLAGTQRAEFPGETLQTALDHIEAAVKAKYGPVFGRLSDPNGPFQGAVVDVRALKAHAALEKAGKWQDMTAEERRLTNRILELGDSISPNEAHTLQSIWRDRASELNKPDQPASTLARMFTQSSSMLRKQLDAGLDAAEQSGKIAGKDLADLKEARALYRDMHETVYDDAMRKAMRTTSERVAESIYRTGNVSEVNAVRKLMALANKMDGQATALSDEVGEAARGIKAEYLRKIMRDPAVMRDLPGKMNDPTFARTFSVMFSTPAERKTIEQLVQAAQIAGRGEAAQGQAWLPIMTMARLAGAPTTAGVLYLGPKALAHAMTKPELRVQLPKLAAYSVHLTRGAGGATVGDQMVRPSTPSFVARFIEDMRADGYDLTEPPP